MRKRRCGAYIDAEHAIDPGYARRIGVKIEEMLMFERIAAKTRSASPRRSCVRMRGYCVCRFSGALCEGRIEGEMATLRGAEARLSPQALRKLTGAIGDRGAPVSLSTKSARDRHHVGNPETTPAAAR